MSYWQTLALAAQDAQRGGEAYGQGMDLALKRKNEEMASKEKMMELALKDAFYEDRQAQMGLELLSKMPVMNQSLVDEETRAALSPFGRIQSIQPVMDLGLKPMNIPQSTTPGMDTGAVGPAAKKILDGYKSGVNQYAPAPLTPQEQSIERLRNMGGGRAPQSEGSIVQPLEGDIAPQQVQAVDRSLNEVAAPTSPFTALRNPELRRQMFDAMARTGSIPGLAVQTDRTFEAMKGVRDAGFMAAKSSAGMNQQAQEMQAKIEMQRLDAQRQNAEFQAKIAADIGDKNAERTWKAEAEMYKSIFDLIQSQTVKPTRGGAAQEDPNKKDYRRRLAEFEQKNTGAMRDAAKKFAMIKPEQLERIIKTNPKIYGPVAAEAWSLYQEGLNRGWTDVLGRDRQVRRMFEGGSSAGGSGAATGGNRFSEALSKKTSRPSPSPLPPPNK